MEKCRCDWALHSTLETAYHDNEWGVPVHDDRELFERLILEGMQAGLSWSTILKKREGFKLAFDDFDYEKIAQYDEAKFEALMQDASIIRNRLKIRAAISNAQSMLQVQKEFGSFDRYLWSFVDFTPIIGHYQAMDEVPATSPVSDALSRDLKSRGFRFVGSTIIYAFMQSIGMVDDHLESCFRRTGSTL